MNTTEIDFAKGDGLVPAIIIQEESGMVLMLGYMNELALCQTIATGFVHFWSRSRNRLWLKGEKSGNKLRVTDIKADCDRDAVLITVSMLGTAVCHTGAVSCFFTTIEKETL